MAPHLSILLPTFNGARFLALQIQSIIKQTYSHFELLMIDDGSSDNTKEILSQFQYMDRRIVVVQSSGNLGQRVRLRQLKSIARGRLIAFSDQDDIWCQNKLERLLCGMGNSVLAFGRSELIDEWGESLNLNTFKAMKNRPGSDVKLRALFRPIISAHCTIAMKDVITDEAFSRSDPFDWLIYLDAVFSGSVSYVDEAVVFHRIHDANQSNNGLAGKRQASQSLFRLPRSVMRAGYIDRFSFMKKLEHLANSSLIGLGDRRKFACLYKSCVDEWWSARLIGRLTSGVRLRDQIQNSLAPMAASELDRDMLFRHVGELTSGFLKLGQLR